MKILSKNKQHSCCSDENTVHRNKNIKPNHNHEHNHEDDHKGHDHDHNIGDQSITDIFLPAIISFGLLITALLFDNLGTISWFSGWIRVVWYVIAYVPVGFPVLKESFVSARKGDVFSEFLLMSIATIGAFAIGEYPEGVTVMLFYAVGEIFQGMAVQRAKSDIKSLLDQRPDEVTVLESNIAKIIKAKEAKIGMIIQLKAGEKLALDGELLSNSASFNTAALTGESVPEIKKKGTTVLAGMINMNVVAEVKITTAYEDSKLSKILEMVQDATSKKAPTELFIRKFANIYTPIVVFLAIGICLLPILFVKDYVFADWLYRALVFLVISCPCALVISIPLGYFGGIGAASKNGILFKGSNFLDLMANIQNVVVDKTGTLTEGVFKVQDIVFDSKFDKNEILKMINVLESRSSHPIATAIQEKVGEIDPNIILKNITEIPGHGLKGNINDKELLVGNFKLMDKFGIAHNVNHASIVYTLIAVAYDNHFVGYLTIADSIKEDAMIAIKKIKALGITVMMLSGDKDNVVQDVAKKLTIDLAYGGLLPEDKVNKVNAILANKQTVAFVGDGVNDAPVVALSTVGIAMGGLGSDATIETADIVIQDDKPSKIATAITIARQTKTIVWQNITLAFVVKAAVLILGAGGLATMWEAVFADVGVALLAILNAVRIQRMKF